MLTRKYDIRLKDFKVVYEYELEHYQPANGWIILEVFKVRDDIINQVFNTVSGCQNTESLVIPKETIKFLVAKTEAEELLYGQ